MKTEQYFENLEKEIKLNYDVAEKARSKDLDPVSEVEVPLARNLAEKCVGLISTVYPQIANPEISKRIMEFEKKFGSLNSGVCLGIAEDVAREKFCKFDTQLEAIEAGIRIGFAYATLGVVSSPIEGFTFLKLKKTAKGKDYFAPYFSGPIRSAGTTASCVVLFIIDHLREIFGYDVYDPTEKEIKRAVTEIFDFHERITNLQYLPTEEEVIFLASHVPVQISGEPSEKLEASNFKDLERVDTNFLRSGFCLVYGEGLAQKAPKALRILKDLRKKGFKLSAWDFLEEYCEMHEKNTVGKDDGVATYLKDLVAGRPIFGHPSRSGAFRFRYGRSRVAGFSAVSVHPATMGISDGFLAVGTQLKIEKPTKGCVISVCDGIDGPIVKLKDGSVCKISDFEESKRIYPEVSEIIYFGDLLFPFGDVANRNAQLVKPGYVEEWWNLELKKLGQAVQNPFDISLDVARGLSRELKVPLHPNYIYFWTQISYEEFLAFLRWLSSARLNNKIVLPYSHIEKEKFSDGKRVLELLGVPHEISTENVLISEEDSKALFSNLGLDLKLFEEENKFIEKEINFIADKIISGNEKDVLKIINSFSEFEIKDKAGEFIGCRMGRPEKAKLRKLTGSPHVLFPVGEEGGRFRSVQEASSLDGDGKKGTVNAEFPIFFCKKCNKETILRKCDVCNELTEKKWYCYPCREVKKDPTCSLKNIDGEEHGACNESYKRPISINQHLKSSIKKLGLNNNTLPELVKGIKKTNSRDHNMENLGKGILRAKYGLNVNKDGTIRYDMTELPVTHFKPKEIFVSVEKIKELGYLEDVEGKALENEDQVIELMPHDVILPCCSESGDEKADDVFLGISKFLDELLEKLYGIDKFYNLKNKEDLVGQLCVCMAPHNCAGVIGRIIGFSHTQGLMASPYMHAAMRRDCDGDEAACMMLLDVLINFSRKYLPSHRGGTQDAPLVLNGRMVAGEVDDQILDLEMVKEYPLELYEKAEQGLHSSEVTVEMVKDRLKNNEDPFTNINYTHGTSNFNEGILCSSYKKLPTMGEKVDSEMVLVEKIRAVDTSDVARLIIERHFIRDIRGNLRKFSMQGFRCVKCNEKFRRPPLKGNCSRCNGKIIFTISEGGIVKYLEPALALAKNYNVPVYVRQNIELTKRYIESIFGREETKQTDLKTWFA